ncbi:Fur-regulated basic protein FbpA [Bacillus tuaregi]|uniref:Fur-regulated basic protein FbpA n=1 Tax=Bacillus tuaregi TaxID=1816695 RepID=UPI0008F8DD9E|nr:Fur-regulated basic protein FbpA [Bacillus tuaregi]
MGDLLRHAVQSQRQRLIHLLTESGVYYKSKKHLDDWTLSDLEKEYRYLKDNGLLSNRNARNRDSET